MENLNKNEKTDFNAAAPKTLLPRGRSFCIFFAMFWAFFLALAISNVASPYFSKIISGLLSGITSLLIGVAVAFVFYRFVDFIERVVLKNAFSKSPYKFAIKRSISIFTVLLVIFGVLAIFMAILVPKIIEVVQRITAGSGDGGTQIYNNVVNEICNIAQRWFGAEVSQDAIKDVLNGVFNWFLGTVIKINDVFAFSANILSGLLNVLLGMLLAILILKDKEKISRFCRRYSYSHFKKERADEICVLTNNASKILFNYVICKIIEFTIIFATLGITYTILGLEFTWELALLIGIFNFIPYFGIYIGSALAALITLIFNSVNATLYMLIATIVITTIEFNIIVPIITSKRLKVSSLVVISSIIIGGAVADIWGMLFAPPIFAIISAVVIGNIELKENHLKYVMELNKAREKNLQDEKEQLGIMPLGVTETKQGQIDNNNKEVVNNSEPQKNAKNDNTDNVETQVELEDKSENTQGNSENSKDNNAVNEDNKDKEINTEEEKTTSKTNKPKTNTGTKNAKKTAKTTSNATKTKE